MSSFQFPELYILFLNRMSIVNVDMASVLGVQCVVNVDFRFTMLVATLLPLFVLLVCAAVLACQFACMMAGRLVSAEHPMKQHYRHSGNRISICLKII